MPGLFASTILPEMLCVAFVIVRFVLMVAPLPRVRRGDVVKSVT